MRQRLVIELEGREESVKEMATCIEATVIGQIGVQQAMGHVAGYSFRRETFPERVAEGLQIPDFLLGRRRHNG